MASGSCGAMLRDLPSASRVHSAATARQFAAIGRSQATVRSGNSTSTSPIPRSSKLIGGLAALDRRRGIYEQLAMLYGMMTYLRQAIDDVPALGGEEVEATAVMLRSF